MSAEVERGQERARRGLTTLVVAGLAVLVVGAIYLRPSLGPPSPARPSPTSIPRSELVLVSASFGDPDHGVVTLFPTGQPNPLNYFTYATADGGRSWTAVPRFGRAAVLATYVNERTVVAQAFGPGSGASISDDRGRTWRTLADPLPAGTPYPSSPTFLDADHGWWLKSIGGPGLTDRSQPVELWRTRNGGRSWQRLAGEGIPEAGSKTQLVFADSLHGALLVAGVLGLTTILATDDGGTTWRSARTFDAPLPSTAVSGGRLFVHSGRLVLTQWAATGNSSEVGVPRIQAGTVVTVHTYVLASDDGGQTWSQPRPGPSVSGLAANVLAGPVLGSGGRLALLEGRRLWTSDDAGVTWVARVVQLPEGLAPVGGLLPAGDGLFVIAVPESGPALLANARMLLRSRDGGVHWTGVALPKPGRR